MTEIILPLILFGIWTLFSVIFISKYKKNQTNNSIKKISFWNNSYVFDSIPSVFPTLGIFCTALGITIGIWNFNTTDIQASIPELLKGLRLAFIATMAGIIGLIIFQKINAIIQKQIDDNPNRIKEPTDELSAINKLTSAVQEMKKDNETHIEKLVNSFSIELESKVSNRLKDVENQISNLTAITIDNQKKNTDIFFQMHSATNNTKNDIVDQLKDLRKEQKTTSEKANKNTDEIIKTMTENNKLTIKKFDEFSELLKQNNTEALVEVMKRTTEQFNSQMSELINRLVQENFAELNNSVKNLNDWQVQNKEQVQKLTENFQQTTEMFTISATTLKEVAINTKKITDEDSKLNQIVTSLNKILIEDNKFSEIINNITLTIQKLEETTEQFDQTGKSLNKFVKTEMGLHEAARILISQLQEFKDFNGDLWQNYRKEMEKSVNIIKNASLIIKDDLKNINGQFINSLNDTFMNLDECIQRIAIRK